MKFLSPAIIFVTFVLFPMSSQAIPGRCYSSITAWQAEDAYTYLVSLTTLLPESMGSWAEWTMVIVTLGAVLIGLRTLRVIRHLVVANRDAAEAARDNAIAAKDAAAAALREVRVITSSERAYVFAKVEVTRHTVSPFDGTAVNFAKAVFVNHGKTPAVIVNMAGRAVLADTAPQQLAQTSDDDRHLPKGWVIASGLTCEQPIDDLRITSQQMDEMFKKTKTLYCAGFIKYNDILGNERITGYCWEYVPDQQLFTFCQNSRLNYYS